MENELIIPNSWWKNNWKWFLPAFSIFILLVLAFVLNSNLPGNLTTIAQGYSDSSLTAKAIVLANSNQRVQEVLGPIDPIDQLAILEGNTIYANNNNSVEMTVRITGKKGLGKMDISAVKSGTKWQFQKINIRIKAPKEEIQILKKPK